MPSTGNRSARQIIEVQGVRFCSCKNRLFAAGKAKVQGIWAHGIMDIDHIEAREHGFVLWLRCGAIVEAAAP